MLTCVPMTSNSNKMLNLKDIDELLFVLNESESTTTAGHGGSISMASSEQTSLTELKSSSLRAMYASKACRKSVMIGDSLNMCEMKRIITHLHEIDKPWNCPHGRVYSRLPSSSFCCCCWRNANMNCLNLFCMLADHATSDKHRFAAKDQHRKCQMNN